MRKLLLVIVPILLAIIVFIVVTIILNKTTKANGALQVTSLPQATVFLNNKPIGKTPLCKCEGKDMLPVGDYSIRLVPTDASLHPYDEKITINPSVLTVLDRIFSQDGKESGSTITLAQIKDKKRAELFVASFPYGADIAVDSEKKGTTPTLLNSITDSDHELTVSKIGYATKTVRIHGVLGYQLSVVASLATDIAAAIQDAQVASPTGSLVTQVVILDTPTGFLRVRDSASLGGLEIAQVKPGEKYSFVSEQEDWLQIKLRDGKLGWVSDSYAKKE